MFLTFGASECGHTHRSATSQHSPIDPLEGPRSLKRLVGRAADALTSKPGIPNARILERTDTECLLVRALCDSLDR